MIQWTLVLKSGCLYAVTSCFCLILVHLCLIINPLYHDFYNVQHFCTERRSLLLSTCDSVPPPLGHCIAHEVWLLCTGNCKQCPYSKQHCLSPVNNCKNGESGSRRWTVECTIPAWCLCRNYWLTSCIFRARPTKEDYGFFIRIFFLLFLKLWHNNLYAIVRLRWRARLACKLRSWHLCASMWVPGTYLVHTGVNI